MIQSSVILIRGVIRMIKRGFFDDGFGDLVGELVEVLEILVSSAIAAAAGCGSGGIPRGVTAFIHYTTTTATLSSKQPTNNSFLSLDLMIYQSVSLSRSEYESW